MNHERWQRIEELFHAAMERPPEARESYLAGACVGDEALLRKLSEMLRSAPDADGYFAGLAARIGTPGSDADHADHPDEAGRHIGPYRLVRRIGRGGMGAVYLAVRADRLFEKQVAIKLLPVGLGTPGGRRRFLSEQQILARLEHPGVARLLDAGVTDDATPYIVMEYVEGTPIDEYCAERACSLEERLRLFLRVCEAVDFAHRSLVVHRDLKPGNILVTEAGEVKLLDFGIAKVVEDEAHAQGTATLLGGLWLTPAYASPEQLRGDPVTTASDVYSLGALLYRLLTGCLPFALPAGSPAEIERIVSSTDPRPPSEALGPTKAEAPLRRRLRGDLDAVVLQALRKEPERRYARVDDLAAELRRYLAGRPVSARPDSWAYRGRKFVRRHPAGSALAVGLMLLAAGYFATLSAYAERLAKERDRARLEAAKAEQVSGFLVELFDFPELRQGRGDTLTARVLLGRGAQRLLEPDALAADPEVRSATLQVLGTAHHGLGFHDDAVALLEESLALRRELRERPEELAEVLVALGRTHTERSRHDLAEPYFAEAVELLGSAAAPPEPVLAEALFGLARAIRPRAERSDSAAVLMRRAVALRGSLQGEDHPDYARDLAALAYMTRDSTDREAALHAYRASIERLRRDGARYPLATSLHNLAYMYRRAGRYADAEPLFREAIELRRALQGDAHPGVVTSIWELAEILQQLDRHPEALELLEEVIELERQHRGPRQQRFGTAARRLGTFHLRTDSPGEALGWFEQALEVYRGEPGADDPLTALAASEVGEALHRLGRLRDAERKLQSALEILRQERGADHPWTRAAARRLEALQRDGGQAPPAQSGG